MPKVTNLHDLTNLSFNGISIVDVLGRQLSAGKSYIIVNAKCHCGKTFKSRFDNLKSGNTKSCGCRNITNPPRKIHGLSHHKINRAYKNIIKRCYDINDTAYVNYGARGIVMCEEWLNNFVTFFDWCIANGWRDGLEVDRINNDGNYTPSNCRIATHKENMRNRRCSMMLEYNGETKSAAEWADEYNINDAVLRSRINRGWEIEKALTTKTLKYKS